MKQYSDEQIDAMVRLRYGQLVTNANNTAFVSYKILGEIFGCSG